MSVRLLVLAFLPAASTSTGQRRRRKLVAPTHRNLGPKRAGHVWLRSCPSMASTTFGRIPRRWPKSTSCPSKTGSSSPLR